jgi:phenylacetate-CoA ligase
VVPGGHAAGPADDFATARALRTARYSAKHVPAYRDYLFSLGLEPDNIRSLDELPETDKRSYADVYPLAERCIGGRLPLMGTTLDESSVSTGKPYNWARSEEERRHVRRMIAFFTRYTFGDEPLVILYTFSMGAWATGLTHGHRARGPRPGSRPSSVNPEGYATEMGRAVTEALLGCAAE